MTGRSFRTENFLAFWTGTLPSLTIAFTLTGLGITLALLLPAMMILPSDKETVSEILGTVLRVQAPTMAISLAVVAFIVAGVHRRDDTDNPLYELFLLKAGVRPVFALTTVLTLGTAAAYFASRILDSCEIQNLILFVGGSLFLSILVTLIFVFRALSLLRPGKRREFKRDSTVNEARRAAHQYLLSKDTEEQSWKRDIIGPDQPEAEASRALERRFDDIGRAIEAGSLVELAEEIDTVRIASAAALEEVDAKSKDTMLMAHSTGPDWPTQRPVTSGLKRLLCTAFELGDSDIQSVVLDRTMEEIPESIRDGNEVFLLATLSAVLEAQSVAFEAGYRPLRPDRRRQVESGLSRSLRSALSSEQVTVPYNRRARMAHRVVATLVEYGGSALLQNDDRTFLVIADALRTQLEAGNDEERNVLDIGENGQWEYVLGALRSGFFSLAGLAVQQGRGELLGVPTDDKELSKPRTTDEATIEADCTRHWFSGTWVSVAWLRWVFLSDPDVSEEELVDRPRDFVRMGCLWWFINRELQNGTRSLEIAANVRQDLSGAWRRSREAIISSAEASPGLDPDAVVAFCDREFSVTATADDASRA